MPNEFIVKNGLISQGNITISGSITATGGVTVSGSIASASYASNAELLDGLDSTVFTLTSSFNAQTASFTAFTSSMNSFSASILTNVTALNAKTASFATTGSNTFVGAEVISGSLAISGSGTPFTLNTDTLEITGSLLVTGSTTLTGSLLQLGNFTTTGTIIAQTINVQTVTSSIVYSSGSNVFGNSLGNSQTFTGSVLITGSLTIAGASSATSYNGATIFGSTIACSPIGCFATSCATSFIGGTMSGTTIFGSTIACSPIGCFATSCATSFIGGTLSGTTIYGSTAVCSPVGKFTTCLDLGGALTGTSATFSGLVTINNNTRGLALNRDAVTNYNGIGYQTAGVQKWFVGMRENLSSNNYIIYSEVGTDILTLNQSTGAATFSSTITGTTIYGSTAVCSPSIIACTTSAAAITIDGYSKLSFKDRGTEYGTINASRYNFGGESTMMSFQSGNCFLFLNGTNCLMFIGSNGNVGIGTATPGGVLDAGCSVFDATTIFRRKSQTGDAGWTALRLVSEKTTAAGAGFGTAISFLITDSVNTNCSLADLVVERDGSNFCGAYSFRTYAGSGTGVERMRITSAGNVGIGTPDPAGKLAVLAGTYQHLIYKAESTYQSSLRFNEANNGARFYTDAGTEEFRMQQQYTSTGFLTFYTGTTERMRIKSDGSIITRSYLNLTDVVSQTDSTASWPVISFSGANGTSGVTQGAGTYDWGIIKVPTTYGYYGRVVGASHMSSAYDQGFYTSGYTSLFVVNGSNGNAYLRGTLTQGSDCRIKTNICNLNYGISEIMQLRPISYNRKTFERDTCGNILSEGVDMCNKYIGFIAQEVKSLVPEVVNGNENSENPEHGLSIEYQNMTALLVKGMQEQQCTICSQASMINTLKTCLGIN